MDAITQFVADISPAPRFTRLEEAALAVRMRAGDKEARDLLIHSVLPWAVKLAARYRGTFPLDDAVGVACATTCRVVDGLDEKKGRLTTYLFKPLWRDLSRAAQSDCGVKIPHGPSRFRSEIARARAAISLHSSGPPPNSLIMMTADSALIDPAPTPPEAAALAEDAERLLQALRELDARHQVVLLGRYWGQLTLKKLATVLGVSRERVRQLERKALLSLKQHLKAA